MGVKYSHFYHFNSENRTPDFEIKLYYCPVTFKTEFMKLQLPFVQLQLFVLLLVVFPFFDIAAQTPASTFQASIGGNGNDSGSRFDIPNSTDYFVIGSSNSNISGDKSENSRGMDDLWLVKLDANNAIIWDKTIGGSENDWVRGALIVDNKLYILESSSSPVSCEKTVAPFGMSGTFDFWLLCFDLDGNLLWQNGYGGDGDDLANGLILLPDGTLLLNGVSNSGVSGNKTTSPLGGDDIWLVQIDTINGSILNQKSIGTSNSELGQVAKLMPDSTIWLISTATYGTSSDKTDPGYGLNDIWLLKMDANLNILQDKCFGGTDTDYGSSLSINEHGIFILGSSASTISGNKQAPYQGSIDGLPYPDSWLIKIDENWNILWDKTYGGTYFDYGSSLFAAPSNKLVMTVTSYSGISGNKTAPLRGDSDIWLLILESDGTILQQETYGGSSTDFGGFSNNAINPSELFFGGSSLSGVSGNKTVPSNGGWDIWLMTLDASQFLSINEKPSEELFIYPNPISNMLFFNNIEEHSKVLVFNQMGQLVIKTEVLNSSIETNSLSSGIYMIQVETELGTFTEKIIKE
jgi:hypothetical protein